jgi:hypothetical protein
MRENPYWEADGRTTSQEIRLLQWNPFFQVSPSRSTLFVLVRYPRIYFTTIGVNPRSTGELGMHLLSPVRNCCQYLVLIARLWICRPVITRDTIMRGPSKPTAPDIIAGPDTEKSVLSEACVQRKPVVNGNFLVFIPNLNTCIKRNLPVTKMCPLPFRYWIFISTCVRTSDLTIIRQTKQIKLVNIERVYSILRSSISRQYATTAFSKW